MHIGHEAKSIIQAYYHKNLTNSRVLEKETKG